MSEPTTDMALTESPDIQSLVFYPNGTLNHAGYCLFRITDRGTFQKWLKKIVDNGSITTAKGSNESGALPLNIAFTASGLKQLLGSGWVEESYDVPFVEGMVTDHRSRLLGDVQKNDPKRWLWGRKKGIDGLLIAFGEERKDIENRLKVLGRANGAEHAIPLIFGELNPPGPNHPNGLKGKEAFGFDDGISQPVIIGTRRHKNLVKENSREAELHGVPAGEFVLGYPDGTDPDWTSFDGSETLPRSPATTAESDLDNLLEAHWEWPEKRDLGKHGTYLVVRQLAQNVDGFWKYLKAAKVRGETAEELGAKLVGRHKNGTTLEPQPKSSKPTNNSFDFSDDAEGLYCPLGSHIRRSNPRTFGAENPKEAKAKLKVTNRHRILRRGRVYTGKDGMAEGLFFLCLNASITRQFEFVQSTWCNGGFFNGLEREVDPIIGTVRPAAEGLPEINRFTVQDKPYRRVLNGLGQFVTVKGGAYFFMPGLNALKCIARAP